MSSWGAALRSRGLRVARCSARCVQSEEGSRSREAPSGLDRLWGHGLHTLFMEDPRQTWASMR